MRQQSLPANSQTAVGPGMRVAWASAAQLSAGTRMLGVPLHYIMRHCVGCTRVVSNATVAVTLCLLDLLGAHLMRMWEWEFVQSVHIVLLSVRACCAVTSYRCNDIQEEYENSSNGERHKVD